MLSDIIRNKFQKKERKYLFIGGCARSGTSSLTKIIGSHRKIILGMERFNNLCEKDSFSLSPNHFSYERFFNVQEGDTFYMDFLQFHNWDPNIYKKYDTCNFIGAKYTDIHNIINHLNESFGEIVIFYIYRNIFDVAESWNKRAEKGNNWPSSKDYKEAVFTWNRSLETIKYKIESGQEIYCVSFDDLFFTSKPIDKIFERINLKIDRNVKRMIKKLRRNAPGKKQAKGVLNSSELDYIKQNARFELYDYFNEHYNLLR